MSILECLSDRCFYKLYRRLIEEGYGNNDNLASTMDAEVEYRLHKDLGLI